MVVVDRRRAARLFVFVLLAAALVWYVWAKRAEFYQAAHGAQPPARDAAMPASALTRTVPFALADPFAEGRIARERARSRQVETLQALIDNAHADGQVRAEAARQLAELQDLARREADVETLLRAKDYPDVLAILYKDHADVIVRSEGEFGPPQAAAVIDAVQRVTGLRSDRIAVVPRP